MQVLVAICTYLRPDALRRTVLAIQEQASQVPDVRVPILVVDNDPELTARTAASTLGVTYVSEPRRGVGHARNRALDEAGSVDALLFFDDDQIPTAEWLVSMLAAHTQDPTAIWVGPVQPILPASLPAWAGDGWPWRRTEYPHGTRLPHAGDGNLLLPRHILDLPDCRYASQYGQGMGQDTELLGRLVSRGSSLRYAPAAAAFEDLPPERLVPQWVTTRAFNSSLSRGRIWMGQPGGILHLLRSTIWHLLLYSLRRTQSFTGNPAAGMRAKCDGQVIRAYLCALRS
jgi:succinoglycan biosynthesis protein ExoM